jgi:NAD(P)-dependent dehydrogenase (short-subunit alcohol dehydrogenase family)
LIIPAVFLLPRLQERCLAGSIAIMANFIITGANRGIGLALTKQLAERGDTVIATCREPAATGALNDLQQAHANLSVHRLEVTEDASVHAFVDALRQKGQPIDVLVNNAGIGSSDTANFGTVRRDAMVQSFAVNSVAPLMLAQAVVPLMQDSGSGIVVNISSVLGSIAAFDDKDGWFNFGYKASKAALNMLSKMLSIELRPHNIGVLNLHPGWVRTDMGGPDAHLSTAESAAKLIQLIDSFAMPQSGAYLDPDGNTIPW